MNAVFLKALSRNKQNNKGTITFEGKEYSDVIFETMMKLVIKINSPTKTK